LHAARSTATRSIPSRCHLPNWMLSASLIACRCRPATRSSSAATRCTRACPSRRAHGTSSRVSSEGGRCRSHQLTASLVRYVLTGFVDFRAAVEAVRPFYGPIPGALVTPPWHAECSAQRPHPSLHTGPSQARHPLPNCMLSASLSSQARCPHSVWSGQRACKCSSRRPHPTPLFTGTLPTPFGAGSNDFPSPHLGMNRERLCRAYGGVRGEPDCL
jgi:hypothetical protein